MKLLTLILRNFKGRTFTLEADGLHLNIFGANATGKTTLFDAFCWLLFDKDSQNKKDFAIKNLDETGQEAHNMDHEVAATIEIDGRETALRKVYSEKWTKKRGSVTADFTGHETSYWIDGVSKSKKEYDAFIAGIASEMTFKLLTNPAYFNEQLHWQERRRILLDICGDITDEEVIQSSVTLGNKNMLSLLNVLNTGRTLDDYRKIIAARKAEINKEIEKIPARIDEARRALPNIDDLPHADVLKTEINSLRKQQQEKQQELARIEAGGQSAENQKQLRELEGKLQEIRNRHRVENDDMIFAKRQQKQDLAYKVTDIARQVEELRQKLQVNSGVIAAVDSKLEKLRAEYWAIDGEKLDFNAEQSCPTCGQGLPADQIQAAREKAEAAFNTSKSKRLEEINARGMAIKAEALRLGSENQNLSQAISKLDDQKVILEHSISTLQTEIENQGTIQPVEDHKDYQKVSREITRVREQIEAVNRDARTVICQVQSEIHLLGQDISSRERGIVQHEQREQGLRRIKELEDMEKSLGAEFEKLDGEQCLTEQFIQSKVRMLESRINSRFQFARFKLFDVQVNGGLVECCETTFHGVPYSSGLNNAARINVGLDIINTLAEHYRFSAPIFVDNAESVVNLVETKAQMIRLVVSAGDKTLRVERDSREPNLFREAV
ncbi:AAA family ATPase [Sporomusa sphaeroides]|uniref:AAA family ATPase n=1 Tax=Sporomusa sphaeroides TaxID=47679 RepID=UPI00202DC896|nr:AAA family ATPase [Sporomusa sphaeroides]MCM0757418.1 AAA family ATPase [Sporomusa sphaeroides DSM 2875]HML33812.1 AAA family ATPase [Sporomusa sphaeroides]